MVSRVPGISEQDIKDIESHIDGIVKQAWSNDVVVGTPTPIAGVAGDNTITIKSDGDIDFDPSGKYLAFIGVELESYASGDYIKQVVVTNGSDSKVVAQNISLAYNNASIVFTSPVEIPANYWVEVVVTLSSAKGIVIDAEFVW